MWPPDPSNAESPQEAGGLIILIMKLRWGLMLTQMLRLGSQVGWSTLCLYLPFHFMPNPAVWLFLLAIGNRVPNYISQGLFSYIMMLIWKNKHRPEFMSLLVLFMMVGEGKFAYWTSWKQQKPETMVWTQNLSISCHSQPSNLERGEKKERRKKPILAARMPFPYLHEHIYLFFWPKKMRGVSPWKLVWNMKLLDTMQPHTTGHSLQTKLKQ